MSGAAVFTDLKKAIRDNNIGSLYIFWGDEDYLREYYLGRIKQALISEVAEQFNYHLLTEPDLDALAAAVDSFPMMSERTMIVARDWDIFKLDEEKRAKLIAMLSDIPSYCCLIFVYDILPYKPDKRQKKLYGALTDYAAAVEFPRQDHQELTGWIKRRFAALDRQINTETAEYLIFLCGDSMTGLIPEIEKISAYSKENNITKRSIDAVADPILDAVVFDMTNAIARGKYGLALERLRELFQMKEEPIALLAMIGRQVRQIYTARLALDYGKDPPYLMNLWNSRSNYFAKSLLNSAKHVSAKWCCRAIRLCAQTDFALKSSPVDKQRALEVLIMQISQEVSAP